MVHPALTSVSYLCKELVCYCVSRCCCDRFWVELQLTAFANGDDIILGRFRDGEQKG